MFKQDTSEDYTLLWVNSITIPTVEVPLDHYKQVGEKFFRLYEVTYQQDGLVNHRILDWREVSVKSHRKKAFSYLIELVTAAEDFLSGESL